MYDTSLCSTYMSSVLRVASSIINAVVRWVPMYHGIVRGACRISFISKVRRYNIVRYPRPLRASCADGASAGRCVCRYCTACDRTSVNYIICTQVSYGMQQNLSYLKYVDTIPTYRTPHVRAYPASVGRYGRYFYECIAHQRTPKKGASNFAFCLPPQKITATS